MNYAPLTAKEIEDLTCMQAGAPWNCQAALVELFAIYEKLRSEGRRPFDPARLPEAEQDAYWEGAARQAPAASHGDACLTDTLRGIANEHSIELTDEARRALDRAAAMLVSNVQPKATPFLARDVGELLGIRVPELSAALVSLGFQQRSQGMTIDPLEALAVCRARAAQAPAPTPEPSTREHHIALREAHQIVDSDCYFNARPALDNPAARDRFEAGYKRGFDAAAKLASQAPAVAPRTPLPDDEIHNPYQYSGGSAKVWMNGFRAGERAHGITAAHPPVQHMEGA